VLPGGGARRRRRICVFCRTPAKEAQQQQQQQKLKAENPASFRVEATGVCWLPATARSSTQHLSRNYPIWVCT